MRRLLRLTRSRRTPAREEAGFTIIELVAALGILAIGIAAMFPVFWAGLRVAAHSAHRTDAQALATRETEAMHAVPYAQVGFYADQVMASTGTCATPATCEPASPDGSAFPVIVLGPNSPATPQITPTGTIQVGPLTYSVTRYVEWADVNGGAFTTTTVYSHGYKRTSVIVGWSDQAGSHSVREDSILYPGGIGKFGTTTTTSPGGPAPAPPVITGATVVSPTEVDLTWVPASGGASVSSYRVEYSTDPDFVITYAALNTVPATSFSEQVTGLSSSTAYYFRLIAYGSGGSSSTAGPVGQVVTQSASGPCNVNSLVVTGAASGSSTGSILQSSGAMSENLFLTVNTSGDCGSRAFRVLGTNTAGQPDPGPAGGWPVSGGASYTATVPSLNQSGWATGTHTFTVFDGGTKTTAVKSFSVCVSGSTSC